MIRMIVPIDICYSSSRGAHDPRSSRQQTGTTKVPAIRNARAAVYEGNNIRSGELAGFFQRRSRCADIARSQCGDWKVFEQNSQWRAGCIGLVDAFERIAVDLKLAFKGASTRPGAALLGQRGVPSRRGRDHRVAATATGKGDDVVAARTA